MYELKQRQETQEKVELIYSKAFIKKTIKENVIHNLANFKAKIDAGLDALHSYLDQTYDSVKEARLFELRCNREILQDILIDIIVLIIPYKKYPREIQEIAGNLGDNCGYFDYYEDPFDSIRTASELIYAARHCDLYFIEIPTYSNYYRALVHSNCMLDEGMDAYVQRTMYLPPLICRPAKVVDNYNAGKLAVPEYVILNLPKRFRHDLYQSYDVLNILNSISMSIDLESLEQEELPSESLENQYDAKKGKYKNSTKAERIEDFYRELEAAKVTYDYLLKNGNRFYFTHKPDTRGRIYSQGYHIHIQANGYKKALLNFTKEEVLI